MTDGAEEMAEIMNKLIADAAAADEECGRLRADLRASANAEFKTQRELDLAKMEAHRYRLQRDFLISLLPPDSQPFESHAFVLYLARVLNNVEAEDVDLQPTYLVSDSDDDERTELGGHPTESDSDE